MYILCTVYLVVLYWNNAVLTGKLARAKEEGLSVKQMMDQTLLEMVNIWPSSVPLHYLTSHVLNDRLPHAAATVDMWVCV